MADKTTLFQFFKRLRQASIALYFRFSHDFRAHQSIQMFSKTFQNSDMMTVHLEKGGEQFMEFMVQITIWIEEQTIDVLRKA